jgi:hypothetical protein
VTPEAVAVAVAVDDVVLVEPVSCKRFPRHVVLA